MSGTVGTWWFETPTLTRTVGHNTVGDALTRATTYSFGSVCLGSLIVAVVQTLKQLVRNQRRRGGGGGGGMLLCVLECLLACLRNILEFINDWAFVYIGLYGYGFVDAAKNVFQLFQSRGWTTLITNALVVRTLNLVMILVAAATGFVSMAVVRVFWGEWSAVFYPYVFVQSKQRVHHRFLVFSHTCIVLLLLLLLLGVIGLVWCWDSL